MKKIINGRKYDTTTATEIGSWDNGLYLDFCYCAETLYRKKTGEFFIHGEGGPSSKYCSYDGNMCKSGENIVPLTESDAREWVERHLTADEYEAIFGEVEE